MSYVLSLQHAAWRAARRSTTSPVTVSFRRNTNDKQLKRLKETESWCSGGVRSLRRVCRKVFLQDNRIRTHGKLFQEQRCLQCQIIKEAPPSRARLPALWRGLAALWWLLLLPVNLQAKLEREPEELQRQRGISGRDQKPGGSGTPGASSCSEVGFQWCFNRSLLSRNFWVTNRACCTGSAWVRPIKRGPGSTTPACRRGDLKRRLDGKYPRLCGRSLGCTCFYHCCVVQVDRFICWTSCLTCWTSLELVLNFNTI